MSQKRSQKLAKTSFRLVKAPVLVITASLCAVGFIAAPIVSADAYQDQINSLNAQNAQTQNTVDALQVKASNYQQEISQLQTQISNLQSVIDQNQAEQASLQSQIEQEQTKLNQQRQVLGDDIKAMYVDGQMSTIEELATSQDLSAFVDAQTYRNAVQTQIQNTMNQITALENQLHAKQNKVTQLIQVEQTQQGQLNSAQQKQQQLLSMNQAQQADYNKQIASNNAQISSLEAQQAAAMQARFGSVPGSGPDCGGGYPANLCEVPQDSVVDSWGMDNRECVSYAAWAMADKYHHYVPYGLGNANEWPAGAAAYGIPEGSTPKVGSVAIWYVGAFGHAMVVDYVYPDGSFLVSQYNYSYNGTYSTMVVGPNSGFTFIYF